MKNIFILLFTFSTIHIFSQDVIIEGRTLPQNAEYNAKFKSYEVYEIDVEAVRNKFLNSKRTAVETELILGNKAYTFQLFKYNIIGKNCSVKTLTANGYEDKKPDPSIESYRGHNANFGGGEVTITMATNYLSISFKQNEETYYLEQFRFDFSNTDPNRFILYTKDGIKDFSSNVVTAAEAVEHMEEQQSQKIDTNTSRNFICWEMDIALGADFEFYKSYGKDLTTTQGRLVNIVNLMQTDWLYPKMIADYYWNISGMFVVEDSAKDPFRTANTLPAILSVFSNIVFSVFTSGFDCATMWTGKILRPPLYAVSGDPRACLFSPFSACAESTKNDAIVRQQQSHCCGHHFMAADDGGGSPTIMNPSMSGFNVWSLPSQFAIYEWAWKVQGCLVDCSGGYIPFAEFSATPTEGCVPMVVQFNNMSTNGTMWKWSFPGGTPATSTAKNPIVVYNSLGSFPVELEVINSKCSTKLEKLDYIVPRDKPTNVTFTYGAVNNSNDIDFFGYAFRGETFRWKFHDNTKDEGEIVTKTFPKEGEFEVELCVSNDCGETCIKKKISNYYKPIADFSADTMDGCAAKTIKFFDLSSVNVIAWTWTFEGGNPTGSFVKNPIVKYTRPGTYKVKLVVNSKQNNDQKTKEMFITIDSLPLAQFDPVINLSTVRFDNTTLYGKTFKWNFDDGTTSTDSTPTHTFKDGRYEITLEASNKCGTTITKRTITIGAKPIAGFSVNNQNGCVPYTVQFQNTSTAKAQTFEWFFSGGNPATSTDKEPIVTYNSIGTFDVKLIARAGVESDSITQSSFIKVAEGPTSNFKNSISGFEVFFTDQSSKVNKYFWEFGDGKTSTEASPKHNYGVEGEFIVRLITENECGVDTLEKLIAVYLIPKVNFNSDVIKGCAPLKINFKDLSSVDVLEWSWQFESGTPTTSTLQNPTVSFYKAGKYTVKLTVKNSNGTNSATKLRYVEVISPIKCPKLPPKKTDTDPLGNSFRDDDVITRQNNQVDLVSLYPNPAHSELVVESTPGTSISILSLTGQNLMQWTSNAKREQKDITQLSPGTYFVQTKFQGQKEIIKLFISEQ